MEEGRPDANLKVVTFPSLLMTLGSSPHPFESQVAVLSTRSVPKGNFWLCFDVHSGRKHARSNEHSLGVSNLYTGFVSTALLDSKVQYKVLIHAEKSLNGVAFHGGQVFQQAGTTGTILHPNAQIVRSS